MLAGRMFRFLYSEQYIFIIFMGMALFLVLDKVVDSDSPLSWTTSCHCFSSKLVEHAYTYQLSHLMRQSDACKCETLISRQIMPADLFLTSDSQM